jgi:hypothetical protein
LLFPLLFPASIIKGARLTDGAARVRGVDMDEQPAMLDVQVAVGPNGDAEEVAQATLLLRRELLNLDVDAVEVAVGGEPPPGSRAVDVAALGALVVNFADPQLLSAVVAAVRSWLSGSSGRSIKLQLGGDALELTGVSSKEQRRLTDEWLARHTSR